MPQAAGTSQPTIVVLAAGRGTRMPWPTHKSLIPIHAGRGTLQLLLENLAVMAPAAPVRVVVGHAAGEVSAVVRAAAPRAPILMNRNYATTGPLGSLALGLAGGPAMDTWVFCADTWFRPDALAALLTCQPTSCTLAVTRVPFQQPGEVAVQCNAAGTVLTIGPAAAGGLVVAGAILWPAAAVPVACAAGREHPDWSQVRLLAASVGNPGPLGVARTLELPADAVCDVDDGASLHRARGLAATYSR